MTNDNPMGNLVSMISQFNQFKANFHGNAQQEVQQLLSSGKMSQQQFNQLQETASQLRSFFK